jgi:hypothetical protein
MLESARIRVPTLTANVRLGYAETNTPAYFVVTINFSGKKFYSVDNLFMAETI